MVNKAQKLITIMLIVFLIFTGVSRVLAHGNSQGNGNNHNNDNNKDAENQEKDNDNDKEDINQSKSNNSIISGGGTAPTAVTFFGKTYPEAEINIIAKNPIKDTPTRQIIFASLRGDFKINFGGVIPEDQSYGLLIKDKEGQVILTKFYNLNPKIEPIINKKILAPSTINIKKSIVIRGDILTVFGYATPENLVEVSLDNNIFKKIEVQSDGYYKISFDTAALDFGIHKLQSRQLDSDGEKSDFSPSIFFTVSKSLITKITKIDSNNDGVINIKDFSIFLSRWQSKYRSINNRDSKVDIKDFSIFIRTIKSLPKK